MNDDKRISSREAMEILIAMGRERLTRKQKIAMRMLLENECPVTATGAVSALSERIGCSKSTMWSVMNSLRMSMLIETGSARNRGRPVRLTSAGIRVAKALDARR